jgi:uncharacterized protein
MRRAIRLALIGLVALGAGSAFIAENALHIWNRPAPDSALAATIAKQGAASWRSCQIVADDGARLDAWLFTPRQPNGAGVILLHGISDTRAGMSGHAPFLLRAGYTVLLPDSRGHGASQGAIITYGIREAADVHRWADFLLREPHVERLYGLGQSMGAAILLESLRHEPRFRAVVADCPFATFREIAYDRLAQNGLRSRVISWPVVELGFGYTRLRYSVNLGQASPLEALRNARTPVLLIHGRSDDNIPPQHSRALHDANSATQLWEVPHAGHVASLATAPAEYKQRVLQWLDLHH